MIMSWMARTSSGSAAVDRGCGEHGGERGRGQREARREQRSPLSPPLPLALSPPRRPRLSRPFSTPPTRQSAILARDPPLWPRAPLAHALPFPPRDRLMVLHGPPSSLHPSTPPKPQQEKAAVQLKRSAKAAGGFYVEPEAKLAFVIRIKGLNKIHPKVRTTTTTTRARRRRRAAAAFFAPPRSSPSGDSERERRAAATSCARFFPPAEKTPQRPAAPTHSRTPQPQKR